MKANHREVCKFENVFEGYKKVLARLTEIKDALMRVDIGAITTLQNVPSYRPTHLLFLFESAISFDLTFLLLDTWSPSHHCPSFPAR
jgi:hypothetical protein